MNTDIKKYNELGYVVVEDVFSKEEIEEFNEEVNTFVEENPTMQNAGGISIPNFIIRENYFEKTKLMKDNEKLHTVLKKVFTGDNYRFCSHNDIGINRIVGWHKDKLNGEYAKYELDDIWNVKDGEKHEIVKVLTYLEDHSNNNDGLKIVPGSHTVREINASGWIQLNPKVGDIIIFDQRITHRGMERQVPGSRILVSFGFGKNNIFTDNFEKGTQIRQQQQNNNSNQKKCVLFNDTTSQLNWGCHATTYYTIEILKKYGFELEKKITLHQTKNIKYVDTFIDYIINNNINYIFINGEGSLYEQHDIKGKSMIYFIKKIKLLNKKCYLLNSCFDLKSKENIKQFKLCMYDNLKIQLREHVSISNFYNYYKNYNVIFQPDFILNADLILFNKNFLIINHLKEKDYIVIGGNSNYYRNDRLNYDAIKIYSILLNKIKQITNKTIILYASSEEEINWLSNISKQTNVKLFSVKNINWKDAFVLLSNSFLSISGRYHPTLMSLIGGVPSLCISANHCKMEGIHQMFNLEGIVINSHNIHNNYETILNFVKRYDNNIDEYNNYSKKIKTTYITLKNKSKLYI